MNLALIPDMAKDYKEAIAEYLWNNFDASTSSVAIEFTSNEINTIDSIAIVANGRVVIMKIFVAAAI